MRKKTMGKKQHRFTLIELLVSLGVLVIILGFVLQLFVGSQKVWTSMQQRNNIYADARVAMDIMTTMLQSSFYCDGSVPFYINRTTDNDKIYFATQTKQNLKGGPLKYVTFQRSSVAEETDQLKISVFCDDESDEFYKCFPPYRDSTISDLASARTEVISKCNTNLSNTYGSILIRQVVSFEIIPYEIDTSSTGLGITPVGSATYSKVPYMLVLKVTILSPDDYKRLGQISDSTQKSEFLTRHKYTFTRGVYLGSPERLNIND